MQNPSSSATLYCITAALFFTILFFLSLSSSSSPYSLSSSPDPHLFPNPNTRFLLNPNSGPSNPDPPVSSIGYLITGSSGDKGRIFRVLLAVYHPKNIYLLHLDRFAPQSDRDSLARRVQSVPVFQAAQNVHVIGNADFVYPKGSSPVASVLRGASILLRLSQKWDWFINLSARDYPLVTQDDLLHILSFLPKEFNFVNHTSYIGWRESKRLKPIIVDPGLYLSEKTGMFFATQKRDLPNAYQLFTGSPTAILNRKFVEFCILGPDNLPRTLLMYLSNTQSSLLNYFPSILCNSPQFKVTAVNHNLQYASYSNPSRDEPRPLNASDFDSMIQSGSAFATQFLANDSILDRIDHEVLGRALGKVVPGGWCLGEANDTSVTWGDAEILKPGPGAKRLERRISKLLSNNTFLSQQCRIE